MDIFIDIVEVFLEIIFDCMESKLHKRKKGEGRKMKGLLTSWARSSYDTYATNHAALEKMKEHHFFSVASVDTYATNHAALEKMKEHHFFSVAGCRLLIS